MSQVTRSILTVIEPSIELDELDIIDIESGTENSDFNQAVTPPSKFSNVIPIIRINSYNVEGDRLISFNLDCSGFYPTCRFIFFDTDGLFTARFYPKDGDIVQLYIRSAGNEKTFKPIRMDLVIEDVRPLGGGGATTKLPQFLVDCRIKVNNLFTERVQYYNDTSWNTLLNIADELGLGFASNIDNTTDFQTWTNPYDTSYKYIQDITANSYLNDSAFFTSYIDQYYYLNFINVNHVFSQDAELEEDLLHFLNQSDLITLDSKTIEYKFPNMISNMLQMQGTSKYIYSYQQTNKGGLISKNNGYKRYIQYWSLEDKQFINEFIDPIVEGTPGMIPTNKGRIVNGEIEGPLKNQVKFKYLGTQGDNTHDNFMYSAILNYQNLVEIEKFGMIVELDMFNPGIIRFQRIYCQIFEFEEKVKDTLLASTVNQNDAPNEAKKRTETPDNLGNDKTSENGILNEYLSGFYIVSGIEYFYKKPGYLKQRLHLKRREAVPTT